MSGHFITTTMSDPFASSPTSPDSASVSTPGARAGSPVTTLPKSESGGKRLICPFCYTKQSLQRGKPCPNAECYSNRRGIPIPPEVFTHELFPIIIVGASSSGKSHFLAALKHLLVNEGANGWGDGDENGYWKWAFVEYFNPANADDASVDNPYIVYETNLYQRHQTLDSTKRDDEHPPLLLSVNYLHPFKRMFNDPLFSKRGLLVAVTDTAGEHAQSGSIGAFEENYPVLKKLARGAIVMLDPREVQNMANESANSILSWFKRGRGKTKLPVALCISKIDELAKGDETVPVDWLDERFNTDLSVPGRLVLPDIENNSRDILKWMRITSLRATADDLESSFRYHACFATSALGVEPFQLDSHGKPIIASSTGAFSLKSDFPHPIRVLDPLLWILWQHGKLGGATVKSV